jgi:hypothetical protein
MKGKKQGDNYQLRKKLFYWVNVPPPPNSCLSGTSEFDLTWDKVFVKHN